MKRILLLSLFIFCACIVSAQTTYYWVGGTTPTTSITTGSNWNTSINGSGSSRPSSSGASDILVFDGTNVGGSTPTTGTVDVLANGSITCAQMKFVNNAIVTMVRASSGTSTMNIAGEAGEDFTIEAGSSLSLISQVGSLRFSMVAASTGRVSGILRMITPMQVRFENTTSGNPGSFRFTSGASFTTNITASSSSYAFGSNSQSSEKWVVFENGSHLYYEGGYSPIANNSTFTAIEFEPGSFYHHRANNGGGSFLNRRSFGNILIENGATLTADGPVYRINDLTIQNGSGFVTHTSGQTAVMGNITVDGSYTSPAGSTNELVLCGAAAQSVSGTGTLHPASVLVANNANVDLLKNFEADVALNVLGKINFNNNAASGDASFRAEGVNNPVNTTANTTAGSYLLTGNSGIAANMKGYLVSGAGIPANTAIIALSTTLDTVYISNAATATASGVAIESHTSGATLATANANGFGANGSVLVAGNQSFEENINYIVNAATTTPFGSSTGSADNNVATGFTEINADITANKNLSVSQYLALNGKYTLRPLDTLQIRSGAAITGTPGATHYIATAYNTGAGTQAYVQYDGIATATLLPLGTPDHYMPVTLTPAGSSNFGFSVFEGITINGQITGTPFNTPQLQTVVNAVWNINRVVGSGDVQLNFEWSAALEGTGFSALPGSDIGIIQNTGALWSTPLATGDNTNNTAAATVSSMGAFAIGAVAQSDPFVFNDLPAKTYGDADFNGGATSLNTTQPVLYSSSNTAVATIINGDIHITGAGTTDITASQASDGFYPAASITKTLTVNKAALIIAADNKTKFEQLPNPTLTATYTGFVLGETAAALLTPAVLSTTAVQSSAPGTYPITVSGATSNNYDISFVNAVLTVIPKQQQTITFNVLPVKTYGNADFALTATSTNNTIPVVYSSSNTSVAAITGNTVHITGAGTTTITASQAGNDGYFPASDVLQQLVVNKAALSIKVKDTSKLQGEANPPFSIAYSGFVLGETAAVLNPAPEIQTIATESSLPGYYVLTPANAGTQNYNITYTAGRLTIVPAADTTQHQLYVFVNSTGNLNVRTYSPAPTMADVYLFDMMGRIVARKNLFVPRGFINNEVKLQNIASGVYIVAVRGKEINVSQTISIVK